MKTLPYFFSIFISLCLLVGTSQFNPTFAQTEQEYSETEPQLVDTDLDGVPDLEEQGPEKNDPTYDGNSDDKPDFKQRNVASFSTWNKEKYVTVTVPSPGFFTEVGALDPSGIKNGLSAEGFDFGFFLLKMDGFEKSTPILVRVYLHEEVTPNQFYMYGPVAMGETPQLFPFGFNCDVGAEWFKGHLLIHLIDGYSGDLDLVRDGKVSILGGPVFGVLPEKYFFPESRLDFSYHTHPGKKSISIHIDEDSPGHMTKVQIEEINGGVVLEKIITEEGIREYDLDVKIVPCGLYTLRVFSSKGGVMERKVLLTE